MRVLVTGATGRLGRAVLPRLAGTDATVRAMSRRPREGGNAEWVEADLGTGVGLGPAVDGVDTILHLATSPYRGRDTVRVDLFGTRRLLTAARRAGVGHVLYPSIVGIDRVPWGYFRTKAQVEAMVRDSGLPWSIVRATQFHVFLDQILSWMAKPPVMLVDPGITAQPVDARDVADRLVERIVTGPTRAVEDFAGPETLSFDDLVGQWLAARGQERRILRVTVPGAAGAAFRHGLLTTEARPTGTISWRQYLAERYG